MTMNGISSNLKEEIKKSIDSKKREQFKFVAVILLTNLLVAILCTPSKKESGHTKEKVKILHMNHQMMVIPLQALVSSDYEKNTETPVSLISRDKKIISNKAYLHEIIKASDESSHFKIEIPNTDIVKVSQAAGLGMIAIPYVENKKIPTLKKGSKYEISI